MEIPINENVLKARYKNLIIYDIDYLLNHLQQEFELLASYKAGREEMNREMIDKLLNELRDMVSRTN